MSSMFPPQTPDLNGKPNRILIRDWYSGPETSIPPATHIPPMDSAVSPPLSGFELRDIEASEREFSSGEVTVYENAEDLIEDLRAARRRFQRERRE